MSWKNKVKKAAASQGGGPYIIPGKHLLRLDLLKEVDGFSEDDIVVAEFIVEETDSEEKDMQPGTRVSRLWNFSKHKSAAGNFKAFLIAAFGSFDDEGEYVAADEDDLSKPDEDGDTPIDLAVTSDNPLNGSLFYCVAHTIITKERKVEFTKCKWELREVEYEGGAA